MLSDKQSKSNKVLKGGILALGLALSAWACGHDLGVQGKVWEITEVDIRQLMLESAARANFSQYNESRKDSAARYISNLPRRTMSLADKTDTRWIDPSIEISSDLNGVEENATTKEFQWAPMYKKGTRANPLLVYQPVTAMLFFDGHSDEQLEFVNKVLAEDQHGRIVLVEATGADVGKLATKLGRPVFYANEQMVQRFDLRVAPSLLYTGKGEHQGFLGFTAFAAPFQVSDLKAVWELDVTKADGSLTGANNAVTR